MCVGYISNMYRLDLQKRRLIWLVISFLHQTEGYQVVGANHRTWLRQREPMVARDRSSPQPCVRLWSMKESGNLGDFNQPCQDTAAHRSHIRCIRASNLAGFVGDVSDDIVIAFRKGSKLVAVTGNSASGKSMLLAKTIDLLCGAKASTSLLNNGETACIAMELHLEEPHLAAVKEAFLQLRLETQMLLDGKSLVLERQLELAADSATPRLKSACKVNGQTVKLKSMSFISRQLLVVIDASTAAAALAKPDCRLHILDVGVSSRILQQYQHARRNYRTSRHHRERLQDELASRTTSKLYVRGDVGGDEELLHHYIDELDALKNRIEALCGTLRVFDVTSGNGELTNCCQELSMTKWEDNLADNRGETFRSAIFERLLSLRDSIIAIERQIASANQVLEALMSLSSQTSALMAVGQARQRLFHATATGKPRSDGGASETDAAAERVHEMLNGIESALAKTARFIEDDDRGLISALEIERSCCKVSLDLVDGLVNDWGSLARKHGVSGFQLPCCHLRLKQERNGNVEALVSLPKALLEEKSALQEFERVSHELSYQRSQLARRLETDVTVRLPSLSMDGSILRVEVQQAKSLTVPSIYNGSSSADMVNFMLFSNSHRMKGGHVHDVASAGEKARLLLALECALPGSVGAVRGNLNKVKSSFIAPPVAVVYDEIDAHVGGSAANSLASMLALQSLNGQVLAITHSPAVCAMADLHLVVTKVQGLSGTRGERRTEVSVKEVDGADRRLELARMASGDLATKEAETFADALLRDGAIRRKAGEVAVHDDSAQ